MIKNAENVRKWKTELNRLKCTRRELSNRTALLLESLRVHIIFSPRKTDMDSQ